MTYEDHMATMLREPQLRRPLHKVMSERPATMSEPVEQEPEWARAVTRQVFFWSRNLVWLGIGAGVVALLWMGGRMVLP